MIGIPHPYLTRDLPGSGGRIRDRLEDFIVVESPLYSPCDQGEHVYFEIEKRDLSTLQAIELIGNELGRPLADFGYAGLKDRRGITRQTVSIDHVTPDDILALEIPNIEVLWARRHTNKLRIGHLRGNKFVIRVRDTRPDCDDEVRRIVEIVQAEGIPNYFGPQRFGNRGDAQWVGAALLRHDYRSAVRRLLGCPASTEGNPRVVSARWLFHQHRWHECLEKFPPMYRDERRILRHLLRHGERHKSACRHIRPEMLKLYFSAFQAYLFNVVLELRFERTAGQLGALFEGDVAYLHRNAAVFLVENVDAEYDRLESFEISPTGPIYGRKMPWPRGVQARMEEEVLDQHRLRATDFHQLEQRCHLEGGRRPLRVPVRQLEWQREGDDLVFSFFLPKGAYATTFLREVMKNEVVPEAYFGGREELFPDFRGGPPS